MRTSNLGKKLPMDCSYVSTNGIGIAKIISTCLRRKPAVRIRFFRLFKVTVTLKAAYNKSRVFFLESTYFSEESEEMLRK